MGTSESSVLLATFRERLLNDRLGGREHALAYYQGLFPGFEQVIAAEYHRLNRHAGAEGAEARSSAAPPQRSIGPFELQRELGRGGQGVVYLARDARLGRSVALKVLSRRAFDSAQQVQRFHREAALAARLHHPRIAAVFEAGATEDEVFVAMEYVEGHSLRAEIDAERTSVGGLRRAAILERVRAFAEVVRAVQAAHGAGVLHRDLKPSNLVHTPQGSLTVLDFGLARDLAGDGELTHTGDVFGSPGYMSPEQVEGKALDQRSDVFSLGVTLYEWLTGTRPFRGATRQALFQAILRDPPPDPRRFCPQLPRDLCVVLATALARDLRDRYQSAEDLARDLQAVAEGRPVAVVPLRPWQRFARWVRRDPRQASLVLGLVVAGVAAAGGAGFVAARRSVWEEGRRALEARRTEELLARAFGYGVPRLEEFQARERLEQSLEEHPELTLVRVYLATDAAVAGDARQALHWVDRQGANQDETRAFQRIRAAVEQVPFEEAGVRPVGPVEQYAAGALLLKELYRAGARVETGAALDRALWHLENAMLMSPRAELLFHLSYAQAVARLAPYDEQRAVKEAVRIAEALVSTWPESAVAVHWAALAAGFADVYHRSEDPDADLRAVDLYRRALELDATNVQAMVNLAGLLAWDRRLPEALELYGRMEAVVARGEWSVSWEDHLPFGQLLAGYEHWTEAGRPLRNTVALDPPVPYPYFLLAQVELRSGRLAEARELLERARQRLGVQHDGVPDVSPAAVSGSLREVLHRQGDGDALRAELEKELAAHPEDGAAALEYGRMLLEEGRPEDAWIVVDRTLEHLSPEADESLRESLLQLQREADG